MKDNLKTALEAGEYKIEHNEDCNCSFDWRIIDDTIEDNADGNECWEGKSLMVGNELIAEYIRYDGLKIHADIDEDDIPEAILDDMRISDMVEQGDSQNPSIHEDRRRKSLIDWLTDEGFRLYRDNERGFANEYKSIIVTDPDAHINPDWDERTPEEWANDYLYRGDAATQAYNSVEVI